MGPDIANKLKATLFRRRRRQSEVSIPGDEIDTLSPPTTPGIISQRRPSFPFPREPSTQTLTLSLELMTGDGGVGIGGCGGGDDTSDAGDSALTNNEAEQQRTRQHWRMWSKPKQGADAEKRSSVPDSAAFHLSPVSPVSPTSQVPVAPTGATTPLLSKYAQGYFDSGIGSEKGAGDDEQHQRPLQGVETNPTTDAEAATTVDSASDPASPAAISNLQHQALAAELLVQALPALDQRQPQRPHQLPASAGARVQGQSPRRSLNSEEASRHETDQSQLDGQGLAVINSDQGIATAGTTDAASASPRITAADAGGTGTCTTSTGTGGAVFSAGPIPGGDLQQNQKQQQRQVQKRLRQQTPPFSLPSPPLQTPPALLTFPPLAPQTPGTGVLPSIPSLPSLDSIDEDESQSPSPSQSQSRSTYPQSSYEHQASASPAAAEHVAATGRGIDAPPTPGAGHGPLNLTSPSPLSTKPPPAPPLARVEAGAEVEAEAGLPLTTKSSSPASVPSSATPTSTSTSSAAVHTSTRPPAPPRRASRDPNQTVTFDESAEKSLSANSGSRDALTATASPNAIGTPTAEAPPAVLAASSKALGPTPLSSSSIPSAPSVIAHHHDDLIGYSSSIDDLADLGDFDASIMAEQIPSKIWVMRPKASATQIRIRPGDLVDDVRDEILRKYGNSLGKTFDSPDLTLRIQASEETQNKQRTRTLGPEEDIIKTLNAYYPSGQTVKEALVIEIPRNSTTPKPSPRAPAPYSGSASATYYAEDGRPSETSEGYFPTVTGNTSSPRLAMAVPTQSSGSIPHSMTVISSGQLPPIPSPGGTRRVAHRDRDPRHDRQDYPRTGRGHTPSPNLLNGGGSGAGGGSGSTVMPPSAPSTAANAHGAQHYRSRHSHSRTHSSSSEHIVSHSSSLPKSPGHEITSSARMGTPPPQRLSSPRLPSSRPNKKGKRSQQQQQQDYHHTPTPSILTATVPPINVLIVEDNPINLKLLEAFVKRLKVRWDTAMNGSDAVKKWRHGGFHLVLMDIQLPGMNGLEATREIRRLERLNNIGVSTAPDGIPETTPTEELTEQDRLRDIDKFKSPVIIVALTASSLQSDRHEALASGCNDFLTKPVNFVWLERKVMEWGCMQALIDFEGWRMWKELSAKAESIAAANKRALAFKNKTKKNRPIMSAS
ncbi:hypothetical protein TrVGV298_002055 [Trichoderma virens]|nr:hypothetical protein TrVGV298_002055 [Trichoderma virens]